MICMKCGSQRVAKVNGKVGDMCFIELDGVTRDGYVPLDMPFGGGDYLRFEVCFDCGGLLGDFPIPLTEMEEDVI